MRIEKRDNRPICFGTVENIGNRRLTSKERSQIQKGQLAQFTYARNKYLVSEEDLKPFQKQHRPLDKWLEAFRTKMDMVKKSLVGSSKKHVERSDLKAQWQRLGYGDFERAMKTAFRKSVQIVGLYRRYSEKA